MMIEKHVCIVGLGLMGGSLALALRGQVVRLTAVEQHAATRQMALAMNLVDRLTADLASGLVGVDVVILATPVRTILQIIDQLPQLKPDGCMVFDVGSTKGAICAAMSGLPRQFAAVGGHPMCGKETAGLAAAAADLYHNQTFILCANARTTPQMDEVARQIIEVIGARVLGLAPDEHDRLAAAVSHLPYLVSAALMQVTAAMGDERAWSVSASGFRDASRLSGSDPFMMLDILLTNKTAVLAQLEQYQRDLRKVQQLLHVEDEAALLAWLQEKQAEHQHYLQKKYAQ